MFIQLDQIDATKRIREENGTNDFEELVTSIKTHGQLQELIVAQTDNGYELVAGGRRFLAIARLHAAGTEIPGLPAGCARCEARNDLSEHTKLLLEGEENLRRKDFSFIEKAKWVRLFHEAMTRKYDGVWTQELTARSLNVSTAFISQYLHIEEAVKTDASVAKATTVKSAIKRMRVTERFNTRLAEVQKTNKNAFNEAGEILAHNDCNVWIKTLPDASVDVVNFDPPWGGDVSHKSQENHEGFDDSTETANTLMEAMLPELFRVLKEDRFMIFWYRGWNYNEVVPMMEKAGFNFKFNRSACIWYKPDKITDQNRVPEKQLIDAYECFLLARKGDPLVYDRVANNVFEFPRITLGAITHPTEKPVPLCDKLIRLTTVPGEKLIDPTAGSSAFLHAALLANRKAAGCELSKTYYDRGIVRLSTYLETVIR